MVDREHDNRPIGIFDSGFGGLTIMRQVIKALPSENVIYFGDSFNAPYGDRSKKEIIRLTKEAAYFLNQKNIKALLLACNTACVYAYREITGCLNIPVFEIISPSLKMVLTYGEGKKIGVIATKATIYSQVYRRLILNSYPQAEVHSLSCPSLVPLIEKGLLDKEALEKEVKKVTLPLMKKNVEIILLACTHYPLIKEMIQNAVGSSTLILDPSFSVAEEVKDLLIKSNLASGQKAKGDYELYTSGDSEKFRATAERFLGFKIDKIKKKE